MKQSSSTETFGKHLTIDAYGCDAEALDDFEVVFRVLDELPGKVQMHKITTPYVIRAGANDLKDCGGLSGFVMIAESHISLHTFPQKRYVTFDLYSCSMFEEAPVLAFLREEFQWEQVEKHVIKRGLKFPKENLA
ncbi:MAG: adenosylmethionine decarboxylase [Patescibacteria group bacterium]